MGLFFLINGWAGQYPLLDATLRTWYVSAVPVLATVFLGLALLAPPSPHYSRRRIIACGLLAFALCALTKIFIDSFAASIGAGLLSPRPYMTRFINVLVVEPQDNSFPSPEVMLAATLAVLIWAINPRAGLAALGGATSLAFTRMFCGTNYFADVFAGLSLGLGWGVLSLAACRVSLSLPWAESRFRLGLVSQAVAACLTLFAVAGGSYACAISQPRFENKLSLWAAPATAATNPGTKPSDSAAHSARESIPEGEGVQAEAAANDAEALSLAKRSNRFLPEVEKYLKGLMAPKTLPFHLLEVEVAPVKAGTTEYRCAAIRFEVPRSSPNARRWVYRVSADLVRTAFRADSQIQNVDVTAIVRGDSQEIDGSSVLFVGGEIPVFTASIQRKNLIIQPAWANLPTVEPGLWLRLRSRLFINPKILPEEAAPSSPLPSFAPATPAVPAPSATSPLPNPAPAATAKPLSPTPAASPTTKPFTPSLAPTPTLAHPALVPYSAPQKVKSNLSRQIDSAWRRARVAPRPVPVRKRPVRRVIPTTKPAATPSFSPTAPARAPSAPALSPPPAISPPVSVPAPAPAAPAPAPAEPQPEANP